MSRVVKFNQLGNADVLCIEQREIPVPSDSELVLKVEAIGMNRADIMLRTGNYLKTATFPSQLGFEAAGTVIAVGKKVSNFKPGQNVCVIPSFDLSLFGTYADHVVISEQHVVSLPEGASFQEGAALWMAYLTAYGGLCLAMKIKPGDWVAITAATSSVGLAAIQVARFLGAKPIALTLSTEKTNELLETGAEAVIATREESVIERITQVAGGEIQAAFDAVGGPLLAELAQVIQSKGTIVVHGALSPEPTIYPLKLALKKSLLIRGFVYTEALENSEEKTRAYEFIESGVKSGHFHPLIDNTFSLDDVVAAHQYLESNQQFGKVLITP